MDDFSGIKELYDVNIRTNKFLEIGDRTYEPNECILTFKTAEFAQLEQRRKEVFATGGYENLPLIDWTSDKELTFSITHGVLSPSSWAILSNSKLVNKEKKSIQFSEKIPVIDNEDYCYIDLKYVPNVSELFGVPKKSYNLEECQKQMELKPIQSNKEKWLFCYDLETGKKITNLFIINNRVFFKELSKKVYVDYTFYYNNIFKSLEIGKRLTNNFFSIDAKMNVKQLTDGEFYTAFLEIPKIKINSTLSFQLGSGYENSIVSDFLFTAYPDENSLKNKRTIAKISFLEQLKIEDDE